MPLHPRVSRRVVVLAFFAGFAFLATTASAVPAFARKYETSCATCHVMFPKLTAFGEAFRRNGYQFPEGSDVEYTKQEPVSLGSEGYKRVFPKAIWPGAIPARPPFSAMVEGEFVYAPERDTAKLSFEDAAAETELFLAGTAGENISYFYELAIAGESAELEMGSVVFSNLFASRLKPSLLNLRVGKFVPDFIPNGHRQFGHLWLGTKTVGDNTWALQRTQKGLELSGVISGRTGYNVGVVEGRGNVPNSDKDLYAHLTYKVGGLRLDGVVPEGEVPATKNPRPWVDNSLSFDLFGYVGFADVESGGGGSPEDEDVESAPRLLGDPEDTSEGDTSGETAAEDVINALGASDEAGTVKDDFWMGGVGANWWYESFNIVGAVALRHHSAANAGKSMDALYTYAEASYVFYPWLMPVVRIETFGIKDGDTDLRIIPMIRALVRPNVQAALTAELEKEGEGELEAAEFEFSVSTGF